MPSPPVEQRPDLLYLGGGFTLFWWAYAALVLDWHTVPTALGVVAALCFLPTATSERRARLLLWAALLPLVPLAVLWACTSFVPPMYLVIPPVGLPFGFMQGLDSGLGKPNWDGLKNFLDWVTRVAFLLAGVLALAGRQFGVSVQDLTTYLTGQYSFAVYVIGAILVLAAVGYVLGVPYGAGVRRVSRLFAA